jgi:hypothetical protein
MGRGLSDLQRWILEKAASQKKLHPAEVLAGYFGWEPDHKWPWRGQIEPAERPRGQNFSRRRIGSAKYRSTMASLSRSIRRLEERGFVTRREYAFGKAWCLYITEKGKEYLSVNLPVIYRKINR